MPMPGNWNPEPRYKRDEVIWQQCHEEVTDDEIVELFRAFLDNADTETVMKFIPGDAWEKFMIEAANLRFESTKESDHWEAES